MAAERVETASGAGHVVRTAAPDDAAAIAAVHVASWRSSYRDILPAAFLEGLSIEKQTLHWTKKLGGGAAGGVGRDLPHTLVATDAAGTIVGFCCAGGKRAGPAAFVGEVYAIYLLAEAQGRGLGRRLFREATEWLSSRSLMPALVWVLSRNLGARGFYESLGGRALEEQFIEIGGERYPEVAYGWETVPPA